MSKKSKNKNKKPAINKIAWIAIILSVIIAAALFYWINSDKTHNPSANDALKNDMSSELYRANQLTQQVFYFVEQVEIKKMSQEEADKKSEPVKQELQALRAKLSKQELSINDSIRKAMGNIMVDNVMKWRMDNGLIKPDTIWPEGR